VQGDGGGAGQLREFLVLFPDALKGALQVGDPLGLPAARACLFTQGSDFLLQAFLVLPGLPQLLLQLAQATGEFGSIGLGATGFVVADERGLLGVSQFGTRMAQQDLVF
jgi:hypothetical protein